MLLITYEGCKKKMVPGNSTVEIVCNPDAKMGWPYRQKVAAQLLGIEKDYNNYYNVVDAQNGILYRFSKNNTSFTIKQEQGNYILRLNAGPQKHEDQITVPVPVLLHLIAEKVMTVRDIVKNIETGKEDFIKHHEKCGIDLYVGYGRHWESLVFSIENGMTVSPVDFDGEIRIYDLFITDDRPFVIIGAYLDFWLDDLFIPIDIDEEIIKKARSNILLKNGIYDDYLL